ncbi:hypothetical protein HBI56_047200 [Parastagonospora nodorum]|uniref:F-box domain-containing protein n=1 Tax=Phaeosphaeria nodorum (strain SN15 / ATCC MYA-4574 / FGSC 10173) TaxID=321614 RepID=A0A7U2HX24_PHANO|nr:hypothetical protein HBH56_060110 [Parastagonospora nodorum]QRC91861.1 hypothetical protein JI435_020460 [Parastagonospora nodorum SN15]KAH3930939.1 hypothetical protein HBH54_104040 [Parastagonospora nodorum]KAH3954044.1 hypothetical protein HBH53_018720 [Parastagonospora nodorum]KAH3965363.1 hypothetical protein HBH51_152790 [Parastagonospora nodorum]
MALPDIAPGAPTNSTPATMRSPFPLSPELVHKICSNLRTSQVAQLRLVCRLFAEIGKEHLVEELCFFTYPRSIEKVIEISRSEEWAPKVKTLVFENVALKDWRGFPWDDDFFDTRRGARNGLSSYTQRDFATIKQAVGQILFSGLEESAIFSFRNLRAVHSHEGFSDERPYGRGINMRLVDMLTYGKHSKSLADLIWEDRASLRIFQEPMSCESTEAEYGCYLKKSWNSLELLSEGSCIPSGFKRSGDPEAEVQRNLSCRNKTNEPDTPESASVPSFWGWLDAP